MTSTIFHRIAAAAVLSTAPVIIALGTAAISDASTTAVAGNAAVTSTVDQVRPTQAHAGQGTFVADEVRYRHRRHNPFNRNW